MPPLRADVSLSPLTAAHAPAMFGWMQDPLVQANIGLRSEPTLAKTEAWLARAIDDPTICGFAVLWDDQHVGNVILDQIDRYLETARLSVYIGEAAARGAGVGSSALYRLLEYGFGPLGLHKIWLTVHNQNIAAINTYQRLGFVLEGILRDEFRLAGRRVNALYMAILAAEFQQRAAQVGEGGTT